MKDKNPVKSEEEFKELFEKLNRFRKTMLSKSQEEIAVDINLTQSKVHSLENGQGSINNLVSLLSLYHNKYNLDLNSLFDKDASLKRIYKDTNLFDIVEG